MTKPRPDWIAVDWGTTSLRASAVKDGVETPLGHLQKGMNALQPGDFEGALLELLAGQDQFDLTPPLQVVACGMVGARQGWIEAPYQSVPCPPLGKGLIQAPTRTPGLTVHIAPGVSQATPPDVMRGEETQIAGFLALNKDWDGILILPGTHSKWVSVSAGEIVGFRTLMTGEMFSILKDQSVLRHSIGSLTKEDLESPAYRTAFLKGVDEAMTTPEQVPVALFSIRAGSLLNGVGPVDSAARLSGLLIGAEIAAMRGWWLGNRIGLIGTGPLGDSYDLALRQQGLFPERAETGAVTFAGLAQAKGLL